MIESYLEALSFSVSVTGPIFLVVVLGIILKKLAVINDEFITAASRLVFTVTLPALLFFSIIKADLDSVFNLHLLSVAGGGTLLIFLLLSVLARFLVTRAADRGVFVQGAFRGNLGIVGLAFCVNAYGDQGMASASVLVAVLTILYNILSVYTLNRSLLPTENESPLQGAGNIAAGIARNPLIAAIVAALVLGQMEVNIHPVLVRTGEYFAQMTLPLALLCVGGSLSLKRLQGAVSESVWAVLFKLVLCPGILTLLSYLAGFRGMDLGLVFLLSSTPTAAASFVMVKALKGNDTLAANIIVLTTLGSLLTVSIGLSILRGMALI